jgi:hypothetical protein
MTEFLLPENAELLNAITIKSTGKELILGRKEEGGVALILIQFDEKSKKDSTKTAEFGAIMDNHQTVLLKEFGFHLYQNSFEHITFRLNVYDMKNGLPTNNIIQKQTYMTIKDKQTGWFTFDLSDQYIVAKKDIACTVEVLDISQKDASVGFRASLSVWKKRALGRKFSKGDWMKVPLQLNMYAKAVEIKE